jgi:Kef-type K+ transport system membrane component KefB
MSNVSTELLLILVCSLVVISYLFSILSRYIRIPSVLLLLFAGLGFRLLADHYNSEVSAPAQLVELLGVVGLIMIVLEAGLDLKLGRDKLKLIRDSFFSALIILLISAALVTIVLYYWLHEPLIHCIVYAVPLSIMSSSIIIPSIHPLSKTKKEFLVYEASFSDILGILVFNYFTAGETLTAASVGLFGLNILLSVLLSLLLSFILFLILTRTRLNIKFFLIFALLILIYAGGKMLHLPSLIIILVFGLMINNRELLKLAVFDRLFPLEQVKELRHFLHAITAESSFLVRTFFFLLFGFSISLSFLRENEVLQVGSLIVLVLFLVRLFYLRIFLRTQVFPETFFIPRGLITIVLFYKIPEKLKLASFNEGILFFVILVTSVIMTFGMILYKKKPDELVLED